MATTLRPEDRNTKRLTVANNASTVTAVAGVLEPTTGTIAADSDRAALLIEHQGAATGERIRVSAGNDTSTGTVGHILNGGDTITLTTTTVNVPLTPAPSSPS